jgi:NADPH:quinone reductase-like Zn-dependent oxidoreductase
LAKANIARQLCEVVWPLLSDGKIAPVMDSKFTMTEAAAAHSRMESSTHIGKIVLAVRPDK